MRLIHETAQELVFGSALEKFRIDLVLRNCTWTKGLWFARKIRQLSLNSLRGVELTGGCPEINLMFENEEPVTIVSHEEYEDDQVHTGAAATDLRHFTRILHVPAIVYDQQDQQKIIPWEADDRLFYEFLSKADYMVPNTGGPLGLTGR